MLIGKFTLSAAACALTLVAATSFAPPTQAADRAAARTTRTAPASVERLRLATPLTREDAKATIDPVLLRSKGSQQVLVRFRSPSVAESNITNPADSIMRREAIRIEQGSFVERVQRLAPGARKIAEVQGVLNAVVLQADAAAVRQIAADPSVARVSRVIDYKLDLSETVPYITARRLQSVNKGNGVKVAVLDSGIDYTHAAFGGAGTAQAYEMAYGTSTADPRTTTLDGLFPTARVVQGYDFVGEVWPNGDLAPDPDPIDCGPTVIDCAGSHGTHVADIIGGKNGVAPRVKLWAVKVCSAVTSSCSGVALLQGMEYAADPNGDGDTSDRADIVNMSLGSPYGQPFDDDLAAAVEGATKLGILTVASAGNSSDKPYVTGTPAAAPSALSVAQTAVPSDFQPFLDVTAPASIAGSYAAVYQSWSAPLTGVVEAPMQYGDGAGGNLNGCLPFAAGTLAGKIVLVDRGACDFSLKISNVAAGNGVAGIIGLIAPGDPFEGSLGTGTPTVPGYMISQALSNGLKSGLPATMLRLDPNNGLPLVMSMVGSSSRGPSNYYNAIKPEIGAPGASISALAGTGTGTEPFGGTSGAAPMVAGSAALVLGALPNLKPHEVKARLMNNAEREIYTDVAAGRLAEITRIGSGEVRAYHAWADPAAAWNSETRIAALSFGQVDASKKVLTMTQRVTVRNYSSKPITYAVRTPFRFADDRALGAVKISTPDSITVPARGSRDFPVVMTIYGDKVRDNAMNSGALGADPASLTFNEIDGYLVLDAGSTSRIHLPWHVLPRKAADVTGSKKLTFAGGVATNTLNNKGVGTAQNDAYALLAVSPNQPKGGRGEGMPTPDIRAVGINTYPVPAGFCSANESFLWAFAINTWERQTHALPVAHFVSLDTNRDGVWDYDVVNLDGTLLNITDGRQLTWAINRATGAAQAFFYAEHATNTGNTVLLICGEQIGLTGTDMLATNVDMMVETADWYFGGPGDVVTGLTVTPLGERYFGVTADIPGNSNGTMDVYDFGVFPGNTDELGVLLFTNGARAGNTGGATRSTEALQFKP
jgi:subtilisin family serine protease